MTEQEAMNVLEKYTDDTLSPVVVEAHRMAITALEEIRQYRSIGTVEECREAVEKQRAYKPTPYIKNHLLNYKGQCKCGAVFLDKNTEYCGNCGQRIDWSE